MLEVVVAPGMYLGERNFLSAAEEPAEADANVETLVVRADLASLPGDSVPSAHTGFEKSLLGPVPGRPRLYRDERRP